jgi:hypothetical protein
VDTNVTCNVIKELVKKLIKINLVEDPVKNQEKIVVIFVISFVILIKNVKVIRVKLRFLLNASVGIVKQLFFVG